MVNICKKWLKKIGNVIKDYLLIFLISLANIIIIILQISEKSSLYITLISISSLSLIAMKDLKDKYDSKQEGQQRELDSKTIESIDKKLSNKIAKLEDKEKVIKEFIKEGIILEEDLVENLNQEQFIILYHFNRGLPKDLEPIFKIGEKKAIYDFLEGVGFVPVGAGPGAYFFHVISTKSLDSPLDKVPYLESYLREKMSEKWEKIWNEIKSKHPKIYKKYENEKEKRCNLSYFLGKILPSNLSIGHINLNSFDNKFVSYYSRFANLEDLQVNHQRLQKIINLASLEFFIRDISPKNREDILGVEKAIKDKLKIKNLFDYGTIEEEDWVNVFENIVKLNNQDATNSANKIYESIKKYIPVIKEFV